MKALTRAYSIMGCLMLLAGVLQCYHWAMEGMSPMLCALSLLPGILLLLAYGVSKKLESIALHVLVIPLGIVVILGWGYFTLLMEVVIKATTTVTDVSRYERILEKDLTFDRDLVKHYPKSIPADATDVRLSFFPGFMQGGAHFQVRCSLPATRISKLYSQFQAMATKTFIGGDTNDHMNVKDGMPTTCYFTNPSEDRDFPDDFEIMIFDDVLKEENRPSEFYWNHGQSHGVAISKKRNVIVYWAESW